MDNKRDKSNMKREKKLAMPPMRAPTPELTCFSGAYGMSSIYDGAFQATLNPLESGRRKEPKAKVKPVAPPPKPKVVKEIRKLSVTKRIRDQYSK